MLMPELLALETRVLPHRLRQTLFVLACGFFGGLPSSGTPCSVTIMKPNTNSA